MIDFRYHLVSLISVFLALAVGIVLGAGPLRESLGAQLAGQVEQLRTEQDDLRAQADDLRAQNDQLAGFITEIGPDLVAGTLEQNDVVVISDHNSTRQPVQNLSRLLEHAGARSITHLTLQPALWDPGSEQRRSDALDAVAGIAPVLLDRDLEESEQLPGLIVALLTQDSTSEVTSELRSQVWQVLVDNQLVAIDGEAPPRASAVVYAAAEPAQLTVGSDDDPTAAERAQQLLTAQTRLLTAMAESDTPAVLSVATPDNDGTVGILRSVRGDSTFADLSTTDRLQASDGPVLAVLALIEQVRGGAGDYGTTADADARVPDLPEAAVIRDEMEDPAGTSEETDGTGEPTDGIGAPSEGTDGPSDGGGQE